MDKIMQKRINPISTIVLQILLCNPAFGATTIDSDADGVPDSVDNCILVANPEQTDTDNDGFGNRCDADFNNDNVVNDLDSNLFISQYLTTQYLISMLMAL